MLRACIVNLVNDQSSAISGVLWERRGDWITFRDCSLLKAGQPPAKIDGEALIHLNQISFIQVLP